MTFALLVTANFAAPRLMPGDPLDGLVTSGSPSFVDDPQIREELRQYYGLDEPVLTQFWQYLSGLAHGDLGRSITFNRPASELVMSALPWTVLLVGTSLVVATLVGVGAGVTAGWRRNRPTDRGVVVVMLAFANVPSYFLATTAIFVFSVRLGWLPIGGARTPFVDTGPIDVGRHLVLPALALAVQPTAYCFLVMRGAMVAELGADHLVLGRAKGLTERRLEYGYAARNALLPVVTLSALQVRVAVTGTILVETVFAYPGLGQLFFQAIASRDYPVLQACFLITTALVLVANLLADAVNRRLDPRSTT